MKKKLQYLLTILVGLGLASCNEAEKKDSKTAKKVENTLPAPFRHHEKIEVGPELIFDVYSWGRGADSTSSLLILRSDSIKNDFTIASTDNIDGRLVEVFNTDMDSDSNPEVLIYYTLNDEINSADVICFEFTDNNVNTIRFPELSSKTKKQYRGLDKFYVKDAKLVREFNLFEENDKEGKNASTKKKVEYFIKNNSFDLNELE